MIYCNQNSAKGGVLLMKSLKIQMLGGFSISADDQCVSDQDNRSKKVWALIAYLIYHRHRAIPQDELIGLLWPDDEHNANPSSALKAVVHRARNTLEGLWPSAGADLILHQSAGYMWNKEYPCELDVDVFEAFCKRARNDPEDLTLDIEALQLYKGIFLPNMSSEMWTIPVAAYYHNRYIQRLLEILPIMARQGRYSEIASLCRSAIAMEPFHEELHCHFMRALLAMGDREGAVRIYQKLRESLYSNFCILPAEETRALYYEASKTINDHTIEIEVLRQQLQEDYRDGALICEYDFFRVLYHSMERSMTRNGISAHIAMFTITDEKGAQLSKKKLENAVNTLEDQIRVSLRRGDAAARCSISQFVVMLPRANYEDSCMVCKRIVRNYFRRYPRAEIDIRFTVFPIQPDIKEVSQWGHTTAPV